jgi:hypothetical protein
MGVGEKKTIPDAGAAADMAFLKDEIAAELRNNYPAFSHFGNLPRFEVEKVRRG